MARFNQRHYWSIFQGGRCRCRGAKRTAMAFCWGCYTSLPKKLRDGLYQGFGAGYEKAYDAAEDHLINQQADEMGVRA